MHGEMPCILPVLPVIFFSGRTGRMHGEMPVIKPPRKPMRMSVDISALS